MATTSTECSRLFLERKCAEQKQIEKAPLCQPKSETHSAREILTRGKALKLAAAAAGVPLPAESLTTEIQVIGSGKKSNAQKCKEYRQRKKLGKVRAPKRRSDECHNIEQLREIKKAKTDAQRCREYRERQKIKKLIELQQKNTDHLYCQRKLKITPAEYMREYRWKMKLKKQGIQSNALLEKDHSDSETEFAVLKIAGKQDAITDWPQAMLSVTQNISSLQKASSDPQAVTVKESKSFASKNVHQNDSVGLLLVETQLEIKEENIVKDESELIIPDKAPKKSFSNELIVGPEQAILNVATIKQEIDSDSDNEKSFGLETHEREKSSNKHIDRSIAVPSPQRKLCENRMIVNEINLCKATGILKDNELIESGSHNMEIIDKEHIIDSNINLSDVELPQLKKTKVIVHDSEMAVHQNLTKLCEKETKERLYSVKNSQILGEPKFNDNIVYNVLPDIKAKVALDNSASLDAFKMMNPINGRRIVDVEHFFYSMQRMNKHSNLGCNLNDIVITNEYKRGIHTSYQLKCKVCNFQEVMPCENISNRDLNTDMIEGMLSLNCNFDDINTLLAKLLLPSISSDFFVQQLDKVALVEMVEVPEKCVDSPTACAKKRKINQSVQALQEIMSASSAKSKNVHQSDLLRLLLKQGHFKIKEENVNKDKSESISSDQTTKKSSSDELLFDQEQPTIKQEIDSDLDCKNLTGLETCEMEKLVLPKKKDVGSYDNRMVVNEVKLQEAAKISEDNKLTKPGFNGMKIIDEESASAIDNHAEVELPLKKGRTVVHKDKSFFNKEDIRLYVKRTKQKLNLFKSSENLVKPKLSDKERTINKKRIISSLEAESRRETDGQQVLFSVHGNSLYEAELHSSSDTVESVITATINDKLFKSTSESNRIVNEKSSSIATALDRENVLIPFKHIPESNSDGTAFHSQIPTNLASDPYQGVSGPAYTPITPTAICQIPNTVQQSTNFSINRQLSTANIPR